MSNKTIPIKCSIVRGGTSKAIFIMDNQLPKDPKAREKMILAVFGSPSLRQLDGLGGADITTSKLAIIGPPSRDDADVDYTFGQVSMDEAFVDFGGNCGNISSGVAPFAIHAGLVKAEEPVSTVRIHMTNTGNILVAKVRVEDGEPLNESKFSLTMDTAHIALSFEEPIESIKLLKKYSNHIHLANSCLRYGDELFGDKHPLFNYANGTIDDSKAQKLLVEIEGLYDNDKNAIISTEMICREDDERRFFLRMIDSMPWFFRRIA